MRYIFFLILLFISVAALIHCEPAEYVPDFEIENVEGLRPIYADTSELKITLQEARDIARAGKIYSYGHLLIVNEVGLGFHVLNNKNPKDPRHLHFVSVPGNTDVAVKNGIIYADNFNDLISLKVTEDTVVVLSRIENLIGSSEDYPQQHDVYFECVDKSKGVVVGWEMAVLNKPQCYRQ